MTRRPAARAASATGVPIWALFAVTAVLAALAGCSATVDGTGHAGPQTSSATGFPASPSSSSSSAPSEPTSPGSTGPSVPAGSFSCPTIDYPGAHLKFGCLTSGLTLSTANEIWPVSLYKTVEAKTHWVLEEGAGNWGPPAGKTASEIALAVRSKMVEAGGYGTSPAVKTDRNAATTVGGVAARVVQTTFTLNRAWAKTQHTKVTSEKLWIVVVRVSAQDDALWYTSIPNLTAQLWSRVPATIASIRVG